MGIDLTIYDSLGRKNLSGYNDERLVRKTAPNDLETLSNNFFNSDAINQALGMLSPAEPALDDIVAVYFNSVHFEVISPRNTKDKWWTPLQERFLPEVKKIHSGLNLVYFYGEDGKEFTSPLFDPNDNSFYQMIAKMFNGSLNAFACFVGEPQLQIDSWNHQGESTYERFGHTDRLPWYGKLGDFLESAKILEQAIAKMRKRGYGTIIGLSGVASGTDIRLIYPRKGMIVMRTYNQVFSDSVWDEDKRKSKRITITIPKNLILHENPEKIAA